ncbi:isoprenoid synthase domain-containing protein [Russula vinacea]|nr:isoprenoid synthase domain-containing protein [Russula vinacea]
MSGLPQYHILTNPLSQWPWQRKPSEHFAEVKPESDAWLRGFQALYAKSQRSFDLCNFSLLGSLVYPLLDKDGVRVACDSMALFFIYDEFTDKVDGDGARLYAEMVMDAIQNPHKERPQGELQLGETARQFWLRAIKVSSPAAQTRFISSFSEYVYAVIDEASDRARGRVRGIEDYLQLTRLTAGGYPSFLAIEAGLNIPDDAMAQLALVLSAVWPQSLSFSQVLDMYSYNYRAGWGNSHVILLIRARSMFFCASSPFAATLFFNHAFAPFTRPGTAHTYAFTNMRAEGEVARSDDSRTQSARLVCELSN